MKLKNIVAVGVLVISLLVCGCVGAGALIPALNNDLPAGQKTASTNPATASDPIVGQWKMLNPMIEEGNRVVDQTDARWTFEADGSYKQCPLLADIFMTTGTWTKIGADRYEIVCGRDSRVEHYRLTDGRLCREEDQRYVLTGAD